MLDDLRLACRMLARSPGFTATVILVLALGIGGVTAMFGMLYAVMIRPLPYPRPDRLVLGRCTVGGNINPWVSGPDYVDFQDKSRSFAALEAFLPFEVEVTVAGGGGKPERARATLATGGLLPALGVTMPVGRSFTADEGRDGGPPVAIVTHAYWQRRLGGERNRIGSAALTIDGVSTAIVGVLPAGFQFAQEADMWLPVRPQALGPRRYLNWLLVGRLRDGVSLAQAQSDVDVIAAQLERAYPDTNARRGLRLTPFQNALAEPRGGDLGRLSGGAAAILFIAWANVAALLLARGAGRRRELAVRAQVGASRLRLMWLLLTEALVLSLAGGALGTLLASWAQKALLLLLPIEPLLAPEVRVSVPVLLFVLAASVLTTIGCGSLPAWRGQPSALAEDLRVGGRGASRHDVSLRSMLVVGQVAACFVLLVVAALLIRSLTSIHRRDPGFDPQSLLTAEVPLPQSDYPEARRAAFFTSLLDEVRALPGVVAAGAISQLPLRNPYNNVSIDPADAPPAEPRDSGDGYQRVVLPGYFGTMRIPLLAGRDIQPTDTADSQRVVVLSRRLAKRLFPDRNPLGHDVVIDRQAGARWRVVGIVGDVVQSDLREDETDRGTFYRPHGQQPLATMRLAVRTTGDPASTVGPLRALLMRLDPDVPLAGPRTMNAVMANTTVSEEAQAACLSVAALMALVLAAVGLYGLLAYLVAQKRRDIGVRLALGATRQAVAWPVLREAGRLALMGLVVGGVGATAAIRLIRAGLYGVGTTDPIAVAGAAAVLFAMTALAAWLPAHRAAQVDPIAALRCE
ncbi:MAG: ABC transporter permease [Vicinamibacteria bacterium]